MDFARQIISRSVEPDLPPGNWGKHRVTTVSLPPFLRSKRWIGQINKYRAPKLLEEVCLEN